LKFPHRILKFRRWVHQFDEKHNTEYLHTIHRTPANLTSAWYSGFFQEERNFSIEFLEKARKIPSILLRVGCVQNQGEIVFQELQTVLKTGCIRMDKNTVRFLVSSQSGIDFFQNYPLQGQKQLMHARWNRAIDLRRASKK
jgi:hypothetical protein